AHDIAIQYGLEVPQDHLPIALVAVHRGGLELARGHSERALELAEQQFVLHPPQHLAILGLVAHWSGDRSAAAEWSGQADRRAAVAGPRGRGAPRATRAARRSSASSNSGRPRGSKRRVTSSEASAGAPARRD